MAEQQGSTALGLLPGRRRRRAQYTAACWQRQQTLKCMTALEAQVGSATQQVLHDMAVTCVSLACLLELNVSLSLYWCPALPPLAVGQQRDATSSSDLEAEFSLADGLSPTELRDSSAASPHSSPPLDRDQDADVHPAKAYIVDAQVS
jgi:hypothetical protein